MEKMEMTVRRLAIYPRRRRPRSIAVVLLVILAAAGMYLRRTRTGTPTGGDDRSRYDQRVCTVARVVDGDTIDVSVPDGRFGTTRIRLWGVDTPEVAGSPVGKMYFGSEASAFTKAMVQGGRVRPALEPEQKTRGKYGRLLAYVYLEPSGVMLNERLLETGHAYADTRFPHVFKGRFRDLERRARRARAGLWANVQPKQWPKWRQRYENRRRQDKEP